MSRDRFEAMVNKVAHTARDGMGPMVLRITAIGLLRREHAALVRAVKRRIAEVDRGSQCQENVSYRLALTDVLALLAARKEKTRCD